MRNTELRRTRRPRTLAKTIERICRILMVLAIVALGAWVIFSAAKKIVKPIRLYAEGIRENKRIETEIGRLKADNAEMRRQKKYLESTSGKETGARAIGFLKKGEKAIFIEKPKRD